VASGSSQRHPRDSRLEILQVLSRAASRGASTARRLRRPPESHGPPRTRAVHDDWVTTELAGDADRNRIVGKRAGRPDLDWRVTEVTDTSAGILTLRSIPPAYTIAVRRLYRRQIKWLVFALQSRPATQRLHGLKTR